MHNAAERLLGMQPYEIQNLAEDIILRQIGLILEEMGIEQINKNRDRFYESVFQNVESQLSKISLIIVNSKLTDIVEP